MANNNDIEKNANKFSQSRPENGKEFEQMQTAQNQLLGIQATQKQNLMEQRLAESNLAAQNDVMRQAAELGAMSGGNMYVNQATQGVMGRYGLQKPMTSSSKKTIRTPQGIVINNNTTNITTVPANIGGPLQGRPLQFQAQGSAGESSKFKDWISKAFDKQNEEAKKRNQEYARREVSLTKSSNKIMRKLEEFSRDITKKLDPRNIGRTVGGQIGTIFKLFGMGYLAANTEKILDGIKGFADKTKNFFEWIKGDKKETPEFLKNFTESFKKSFGEIIFGDQATERMKSGGLLGGIQSALKDFLKDLGDSLAKRADQAKRTAKFDRSLMSNKLDFVGMGEALLKYISDYITVFAGGQAGAMSVARKDLRNEAANRSNWKSTGKYNTGDSAKRVAIGGTNDLVDTSYGELAYFDEPGRGKDNWGRLTGGKVSRQDREMYGNHLGNQVPAEMIENGGMRLSHNNTAVVAQLNELNYVRSSNKAGLFNEPGTALFGASRLERYAQEHPNDIIHANPDVIRKLLNLEDTPGSVGAMERLGFKTKNYFVGIRRKQLIGELNKSDVKNITKSLANAYLAGETIGKAGAAINDIALMAATITLPFSWPVLITTVGVGALGHLLGNGKGFAAMQGLLLALDKKEYATKTPFQFPRTLEGLKYSWLLYGDYEVVVKKDWTQVKDPIIKSHIVGGNILITADENKLKSLQTILNTSFNGNTININIDKSVLSIFDDALLQKIVDIGIEDINKPSAEKIFDFREVSEFKAEDLSTIVSGYTNGIDVSNPLDTPTIDSFNSFWKSAVQTNPNAKNYGPDLDNYLNSVSSIEKEFQQTNNNNWSIPYASPEDQTADQTGNGSNFNIQAAVDHIVGHALPSPGKGQCGTHVLDSLAAGGLKIPRGKESAYMYKDVLLNNGWEVVTDGSQQPGDVEIYDKVEGKHPHGHMQMWTGNGWYSDFGQNGEDPYLEKGSGGKITRLRYTKAVGAGITPQVTPGSLGQLSDSSGVKSDSDVGDNTSLWNIVKDATSQIWEKTKRKVVTAADGTNTEFIGGIVSSHRPVDVNSKPLSGITKEIVSKYSGANYTGGGLEYLNQFGIDNTRTDANSRRVLSSLFDKDGKLKVNTTHLDPELAERLKSIETELKKGNAIDIEQINLTAAGIDTTISTSNAQSVATAQAIAGLGGRKESVPSRVSNLGDQ